MVASTQLTTLICIAGVASLLSGSATLADDQLNCGAYATKATSQQQQNLDLGCGFQGIGWSSDFNAHFAWCRLDNVKMANLTAEDNARTAALNQCISKKNQEQAQQTEKIAACQEYARKAVEHESANQFLQCGFSGGRWSQDNAGHFDWCMQAPLSASSQEDSTRYNQLQGCIAAQEQAKAQQEAAEAAAKQTQCKEYADHAQCMDQRNLEFNCTLGPPRFARFWQSHFDWCLGASDGAIKSERAAREAAIDKCRGSAFMVKCP